MLLPCKNKARIPVVNFIQKWPRRASRWSLRQKFANFGNLAAPVSIKMRAHSLTARMNLSNVLICPETTKPNSASDSTKIFTVPMVTAASFFTMRQGPKLSYMPKRRQLTKLLLWQQRRQLTLAFWIAWMRPLFMSLSPARRLPTRRRQSVRRHECCQQPRKVGACRCLQTLLFLEVRVLSAIEWVRTCSKCNYFFEEEHWMIFIDSASFKVHQLSTYMCQYWHFYKIFLIPNLWLFQVFRYSEYAHLKVVPYSWFIKPA